MAGLLDFVFLGILGVLMFVGFRIGVLKMLFILFTVLFVYLAIVWLGADTLSLVKNNLNAFGGLNDTILSFGIYVIFAGVIFATLLLISTLVRKVLSAFLLGWVDRLGGILVGALGSLIIIMFVSVWGAWLLSSSDDLLEAVNLASATGLASNELAADVQDLNSWLDTQIGSSFIVRNIGWGTWDLFRGWLIPDQLLGVSSETLDSAIDALRLKAMESGGQ